jgi:hypothetical protein
VSFLSSIITAKFFQDAILSQTYGHTEINDAGNKRKQQHSILISGNRYGFGFTDLKKRGERWYVVHLTFTFLYGHYVEICHVINGQALSLVQESIHLTLHRKRDLLVDHLVPGDVVIKILWGCLADTSIPNLMYSITLCYLYCEASFVHRQQNYYYYYY